MNDDQLKALENIKRAVKINDGDTLSRLCGDDEVLWTASGSWEGPETVTLGDLRAIARIGTAKLPSAEEFRSYVVGSEQAGTPMPAAPGEVDSPEFRKLCVAYYSSDSPWRVGRHDQLVAYINSWGAQLVANALAGQQEKWLAVVANNSKFSMQNQSLVNDLSDTRTLFYAAKERAEKAEAQLKKLGTAISFSDSPFYIPIDNKGGTPV